MRSRHDDGLRRRPDCGQPGQAEMQPASSHSISHFASAQGQPQRESAGEQEPQSKSAQANTVENQPVTSSASQASEQPRGEPPLHRSVQNKKAVAHHFWLLPLIWLDLVRYKLGRLARSSRRKLRRAIRNWYWAFLWAPWLLWFALRMILSVLKWLGRMLAKAWQLPVTRFLLQGLPAVIVSAAALSLGAAVSFRPDGQLVSRYRTAAARALGSRDFKTAAACYERLVHLTQKSPEAVIGLALATYSLGEKERAIALMQQVARLDQPGPPVAHLWLAHRLLEEAE